MIPDPQYHEELEYPTLFLFVCFAIARQFNTT